MCGGANVQACLRRRQETSAFLVSSHKDAATFPAKTLTNRGLIGCKDVVIVKRHGNARLSYGGKVSYVWKRECAGAVCTTTDRAYKRKAIQHSVLCLTPALSEAATVCARIAALLSNIAHLVEAVTEVHQRIDIDVDSTTSGLSTNRPASAACPGERVISREALLSPSLL